MATKPIFIKQGNITIGRIAAANTASDGSGTLVVIVTAQTDGTRVDGIRFRNSQASNAASSAMVHRVFHDVGGTIRLIGEIATPAATRSASAIGSTSIYTFDQPLILKSGETIKVCQSVYAGVQDQFDACPFAGDY